MVQAASEAIEVNWASGRDHCPKGPNQFGEPSIGPLHAANLPRGVVPHSSHDTNSSLNVVKPGSNCGKQPTLTRTTPPSSPRHSLPPSRWESFVLPAPLRQRDLLSYPLLVPYSTAPDLLFDRTCCYDIPPSSPTFSPSIHPPSPPLLVRCWPSRRSRLAA